MPRLPVRLTDAQKEWVEEEAESRDCSQSEVVQQLVAEARGEDTDGPTLEERVTRLEQRISVIQSESASKSAVNQPESGVDSKPIRHESVVESGMNQIDSLVSTLDMPGSGADEKRARRAWLAECLSWMQEQDTIRKADVVAWWDEEESINYKTGDGLWESLVKPALDELEERGVVDKPHSRAYEWVD
jgi:hypothetical protein